MNVQIQNVLRQLIGTKDTVSVTILAKRSSLIHQNKDVSRTTLSFEPPTTETNFSVNFPLRRPVHYWNVARCRNSKWFLVIRARSYHLFIGSHGLIQTTKTPLIPWLLLSKLQMSIPRQWEWYLWRMATSVGWWWDHHVLPTPVQVEELRHKEK